MEKLNISDKHKKILKDFADGLVKIYREELVSVFLYGSAASGEFVDKHSNLNLLIVLKSAGFGDLKKSSKIVRKLKIVNPLFMTESYILSSLDIFPIEFLDIQENNFLFYGKDILKDIHVDISNLRFQCEQELKQKLLKLQHAYLMSGDNPRILNRLLFSSFISVLHILRNLLRLKGITPPYLKHEVIRELALQFNINSSVWDKILAARNKEIKLNAPEGEELFADFTKEVDTLISAVDKM